MYRPIDPRNPYGFMTTCSPISPWAYSPKDPRYYDMTSDEKVECFVKESIEEGRTPEVVTPIGCNGKALRERVAALIEKYQKKG